MAVTQQPQPKALFRAFKPAWVEQNLPAGVLGQVAGFAIVYDTLDSYGTMFARGSLDRTARERVAAGKVKLFWDHGDAPVTGFYDSDLHIGTVRSLEDRQLPDGSGRWGAWMVADIFNTPKGAEARQYLQAVIGSGGETGLSVGGLRGTKTIKSEVVRVNGDPVERFTEFALQEISITSMQAVPDSEVMAVRAGGLLPLASRDRAWDSTAAEGRVRAWASSDGSGDKDTIDWTQYGRAFFAHVGSERFGDYKLPFADVIDGELTAIPRGIFAAAGVLSGARGGVDAGHKDAIKAKVAAYYRKMANEFGDDSITPPWETRAAPADALETTFDALLHALPHDVIRARVRAVLGDADPIWDSGAAVTAQPDPATSDAETEDSQPTEEATPPAPAYVPMEDRLLALRHSYA